MATEDARLLKARPGRGPVAEFESELYASIFRDMAEVVAAYV